VKHPVNEIYHPTPKAAKPQYILDYGWNLWVTSKTLCLAEATDRRSE
jgi:hypothetical protein